MTVLFVKTLTQAESLVHSLELRARGIGLHMNADKMEYICFNQKGDSGPLELVNKFTYLGSSISSNESDISMRLTKA